MMTTRNWLAYSLAACAAMTSLAMASPAAAQTHGGPDLLWQDRETGIVAAWVDGGPTTQALSAQCGLLSDCASAWSPIDTRDSTILWWDKYTGTIQDWSFDENGATHTDAALSWTCGYSGNCSADWQPIGRTQWIPPGLPGEVFGGPPQDGLLWYNQGSGQLGVWQLSGSTVTGSAALPWTCGDQCAIYWAPVLTADFNGDENTDILWWNKAIGSLGVWLLGSDGVTPIGTQTLSWTCDRSGCSTRFSIVGAADVNGDGHTDLTWDDSVTGEVASWLLDGQGNVTGESVPFSLKCDSTCLIRSKPLGYVSFPALPPK